MTKFGGVCVCVCVGGGEKDRSVVGCVNGSQVWVY